MGCCKGVNVVTIIAFGDYDDEITGHETADEIIRDGITVIHDKVDSYELTCVLQQDMSHVMIKLLCHKQWKCQNCYCWGSLHENIIIENMPIITPIENFRCKNEFNKVSMCHDVLICVPL